jgi:hypothetical protein
MKTIPFVVLVLGMVSAVSLAEQTQKPPDDRRLGAPRAIGREKRLLFAVRDENWRLVHGDQLYEISKDPGEKTNVIKQHPEVAAKCWPPTTVGGTASGPSWSTRTPHCPKKSTRMSFTPWKTVASMVGGLG